MKLDKFMQMAQKFAENSEKKGNGMGQNEENREKELLEQIENLEKRIQRLEHHSFVQQEDVT
jgi:hypothetical protein